MFLKRERITAWREMISGLAHLDVEPLRDPRGLVADGRNSVILRATSADGVAQRRGQDVSLAAGDAIALSNAEVGNFALPEQSSPGVVLPGQSLERLLRDADVVGRTVAKDNEALRLLKAYAGAIEGGPGIENTELQRRVADHLQDLIALALGGTADGVAVTQARGQPAARLQEAKTYVLRHLGQPGLSAAHVAAHLGVTPRYVHMLFAAEPLSFAQSLLAERLARAHRMLTAPGHAGETISAIAYAAGFADLSHFNRSFRQRYGCTPSDVRAARHRGRLSD